MTKLRLSKIVSLILLLVVMASPATYADVKDDVLKLCDKMEACVLEQIETQGLPPEVKELITNGVFEKQCDVQFHAKG